MEWILLSLTAALLWTVTNYIDKYLLDRITRGTADYIFFSGLTAILVFFVLVLTVGVAPMPAADLSMAVAAGFFLNYAFFFYAKALERADASRVVPLFQTIPIFVLVLGFLVFGEALTFNQLVAFAVILAGALVLSLEPGVRTRFRVDRIFWTVLLSSFLIAISTVFMDQIIGRYGFLAAFTSANFGYFCAGALLLVYTPWRRQIVQGISEAGWRKCLLFFINDSVDLLGQAAYMFALAAAPAAALVSVLLGAQPFFAVILGLLLTLLLPRVITEHISRGVLIQKTVSISIMAGGIAILFWL